MYCEWVEGCPEEDNGFWRYIRSCAEFSAPAGPYKKRARHAAVQYRHPQLSQLRDCERVHLHRAQQRHQSLSEGKAAPAAAKDGQLRGNNSGCPQGETPFKSLTLLATDCCDNQERKDNNGRGIVVGVGSHGKAPEIRPPLWNVKSLSLSLSVVSHVVCVMLVKPFT